MGLSNEERIHGIYSCLEHITMEAIRLETDNAFVYCDKRSVLNELKKEAIGLWHRFLGQQSNGAHWIMGSSAGNEITYSQNSAWSVPVWRYCSANNAKNKERSELDRDIDLIHNAKDNFAIERILQEVENRQRTSGYRAVFKIFACLESLIYYVRRYDDRFLREELASLSEGISLCMGYCHILFSAGEDIYARAYLIHEIADMIFIGSYPYGDKEKWDMVTLIIDENHFFHQMTECFDPHSIVTNEMLLDLHKTLKQLEVQELPEPPKGEVFKPNKLWIDEGIVERMIAVLIMGNRKFDAKDFKKVIDVFRKEGFQKHNKKLWDRLEKEIEKCKVMAVDGEKANKDHDKHWKESRNWEKLSIHEL